MTFRKYCLAKPGRALAAFLPRPLGPSWHAGSRDDLLHLVVAYCALGASCALKLQFVSRWPKRIQDRPFARSESVPAATLSKGPWQQVDPIWQPHAPLCAIEPELPQLAY